VEPLTVDQGKLRAGLGWAAGDPRDDLMAGFISAARQRVEHDTGLALLTQTRRVLFDLLLSPLIVLPAQARPVQEVISIQTTDYYGNTTTIDPAQYVVDLEDGRIFFKPGGGIYWGLRPFQGWQIDLVAGRVDVADLTARDPALIQAVGLLVAHSATLGRDIASVGLRIIEIPEGYLRLLEAYVPVSVV
jgi:uncharacterized phiE125 gp8 family phage protein